jgi:sulfoxide reductase heme-binding subunit YedZ
VRPGAIAVLATLLGAAIVAIVASGASFEGERTILVVRGSGLLALTLLVASLLIGPMAPKLRRAFGLASAVVAIAHFTISINTAFVAEWALLFYEPLLRAGASTLLILIALAITSFPARFQVARWKALHRLVYVAALLAYHHLWLSPHASRILIIGVPIAYVVAIALRLRRRAQSYSS